MNIARTDSGSLRLRALILLAPLAFASCLLQAQTFAPVPALAFTKPFGGADPLPQSLTIAARGSGFNFGAVVSTATGGAWLTATDGCCYSTPHSVVVTAKSALTLPPGTYNGQIVFTSQSGAAVMTVPVSLTIAASNTSFPDNLPGQMSFFLRSHSTGSTSQNLQVRNGGSGGLSWTLTSSTSDGGKWLDISATSGTSPAQIKVGISIENLPDGGLIPGTFVGLILLQAGAATITVPVSVVFDDNGFNQVNPISFTKSFGGADPLPQTLTIAGAGSAFNFGVVVSTASGGDWLSATDGCCYALPHAIGVRVNASPTLAAGSYTGQVVVSSQSGAMSMTVPVTLTVAAPGANSFDNMPGQMSFTLRSGSTLIPKQDLSVRNTGTVPMNWTVIPSTADGAPWLSALAPGGVTPGVVTVGVSVANLPGGGLIAGTYVGQLLFETSGGSATVPVSVVVGDNVLSQVNAISFTKPFGGADTLPQVLTIATTGSAFNFGVTVSTATGGNWLTATDGCCYSAPHAVVATVTANPALAAGTYTGQIVVTSQSGSMSLTIGVTLTVSSAGGSSFDNVPGQMSFFVLPAGPAPAGQSVQIRNIGLGPLNWSLSAGTSDGGNWISNSAVSGSGPSIVDIGILPQKLPGQGLIAGTYIGELVFQSAAGSVSILVSVVVGNDLFVQPAALNFTKAFGGPNPLPQTLTIAGTGSQFNFGVAASSARGGKWLTATDGCCYGTPHAITATVQPAATLPAGTYTGQIVFTSQSGSLPMTVPVTLTVTSTVPKIDAVAPVFQGRSGFGSNTYLTLYGSNLATTTRAWDTAFNGVNAPVSLDGVNVTVNGAPAFVEYVSPSQININTPEDSTTGTIDIVVRNPLGVSNAAPANRARLSPTLQSVAEFSRGGISYVVAQTSSFKSFIGPSGLVPGATFTQAKRGDTVVIYAIGCGPTSPSTGAGVLPPANAPLALPYQMTIGGVPAKVQFGGILAGSVGLYQFNVVIPDVPAGDQTIDLIVDGVPTGQNLVITVGN